MKLRFLGQAYFKLQPQIPSVPSKNTACYRGRKYSLHVPVAHQPQSSDSRMSAVIYKYRGVSYVVERYQFPTKPKKTLIHCQ